MKRINSILLIFIITLSLILPTTTVVYADSEKEEVTNVEGVSDNIDTIPVWGGEYTNPTITIEDEECRAYFDTDNGTWQRKEGESWSDEHVSNKFRAGTWRYKCNVYIDNSGMTFPDAGDTHKLAEKITSTFFILFNLPGIVAHYSIFINALLTNLFSSRAGRICCFFV